MSRPFFTQTQIEKFARGADHFSLRHCLDLGKDQPATAVFGPNFFGPVVKQLHRNDVITIQAADGSDFDVRVRSVKNGEVIVSLRPRIPPAVSAAAEEAERGAESPVPVKAIAAA